MGDELKKSFRRGTSLAKGLKVGEKVGKAIEKPLRTGASAARRDAAAQLKEQQQKQAVMLAEKESEIAEKRSFAQSGRAGRRSLIKSSPTGLATTLGG